MAAPNVRGIHVTATNKSEIAKLKMYQWVIFRRAEFLDMAAITNTFPTIAVMFIIINKNDSTITNESERSVIVTVLADAPTVLKYVNLEENKFYLVKWLNTAFEVLFLLFLYN